MSFSSTDRPALSKHVVDIHPAALTIEHHFEIERSPSLAAASLLTTPHRAYVSLGEVPEPIEDTYGSPRTTILGFSRGMVVRITLTCSLYLAVN